MALTNFYKGPEANYSAADHSNGIYKATDSNKLWIFGEPTQEISDIMTEEEYEGLQEKDSSVIYLIKLSD